RRRLLAGALGTTFLAACADGDSVPGTGASSAVQPSAAPPTSAQPSAPSPAEAAGLRLIPRPATELGAPAIAAPTKSGAANAVSYQETIAPYAGFGTTAAPGVFPRTIRHAMGETVLPAAPQRVICLTRGEMDAAVELGVTPVGIAGSATSALPPYLEPALGDVVLVGNIGQPNLEAIAALNPDLILSYKAQDEQLYDRLSAIAPTIFTQQGGVAYKYNFPIYAQAFGREQQAAGTIQRYENRVRALNAALPHTRPDVSIVRFNANNVQYYLRTNFPALVLEDLGFPRPPSQNVDDIVLANQSLETIGQHAPASLIVVLVQLGAEGFAEQAMAGPIWRSLEAVQKNNVLMVDQAWAGGVGYLGAHFIFDDIAKHFGISA
ncbi:MAG: ABC transporter substrate-binding protein, partial [Dehalococcoidia bacterium]